MSRGPSLFWSEVFSIVLAVFQNCKVFCIANLNIWGSFYIYPLMFHHNVRGVLHFLRRILNIFRRIFSRNLITNKIFCTAYRRLAAPNGFCLFDSSVLLLIIYFTEWKMVRNLKHLSEPNEESMGLKKTLDLWIWDPWLWKISDVDLKYKTAFRNVERFLPFLTLNS